MPKLTILEIFIASVMSIMVFLLLFVSYLLGIKNEQDIMFCKIFITTSFTSTQDHAWHGMHVAIRKVSPAATVLKIAFKFRHKSNVFRVSKPSNSVSFLVTTLKCYYLNTADHPALK